MWIEVLFILQKLKGDVSKLVEEGCLERVTYVADLCVYNSNKQCNQD